MKKVLSIFFALIALLTLMAVVWDRSLPTTQSMVTFVEGEAYIMRLPNAEPQSRFKKIITQTDRNGSQWFPLQSGMMLDSGSIIRTGSLQKIEKNHQFAKSKEVASSVDVLAENGLAFRLKGRSMASLKKGEPEDSTIQQQESIADDQSEKNVKPVDVTLLFGKLLGRVDPLIRDVSKDNIESISIRTPTASIGIRGTTYTVGFDPESNSSKITVLEGNVEVSKKGAPNDVLLVGRGKKTIVDNASGLMLLNINKNDYSELEEIESLKMALDPADIIIDLLGLREDIQLVADIIRFIDRLDARTAKRMEMIEKNLAAGNRDRDQ